MLFDTLLNINSNNSLEDMMLSSKNAQLFRHKNMHGLINLLNSGSKRNITWKNTYNLPSYPVPSLVDTKNRYLKSILPFVNDIEYKTAEKLFEDFVNGSGKKLQELLEDRAQSMDNWLAEWWTNTAYLEYRDPVVVYSNPGMVLPKRTFRNDREWLECCARVIQAALNYKLLIDNDKIPAEKMGKDFLDMNQYKKCFGTCRIPGDKIDKIEFHPDSKHIVIVHKNNFFKLLISNIDGKLIGFKQILNQLEFILSQSNNLDAPIGVLTSDNRNNWYQAYQALIKDPSNRKSCQEIQSSLFLLALDQPMPDSDNYRTSVSHQTIHGGGSRLNSANRWFDKTIQFILDKDGHIGLCYEHSPAEGGIISAISDFVHFYLEKDQAIQDDIQGDFKAEYLKFNVNNEISKYIQRANENIDKLAKNLDMCPFQYKLYGKDFIKSQKLSPDSYIQMAIQFAFYRLHKVPGAHYESAGTRKFIHGRTETIRSCSVESIAFAKAMLDANKSGMEKIKALQDAINAHKEYSVKAVNANGVDRHLLGLKLIAQQNNLPLHEIYKDPSYVRSTYMRLSTSQVPTKSDSFMCYAPLVSNGYGCCYNPRQNDMNFAVTAFNESPETSAERFKDALEASFNDMHHVLSHNQKSKL